MKKISSGLIYSRSSIEIQSQRAWEIHSHVQQAIQAICDEFHVIYLVVANLV